MHLGSFVSEKSTQNWFLTWPLIVLMFRQMMCVCDPLHAMELNPAYSELKHKTVVLIAKPNYRPHPKDDGRLCFYSCLSVNICGERVPHLADGGLGVPHPYHFWWGYPLPSQWAGTPSQIRMVRVPPIPGQVRYQVRMRHPPWRLGLDGEPPSCQDWMEYPPSGLDGGTRPPIRRQSSTVSTCYTAGGMVLAFTQEDFLVYFCFPRSACSSLLSD